MSSSRYQHKVRRLLERSKGDARYVFQLRDGVPANDGPVERFESSEKIFKSGFFLHFLNTSNKRERNRLYSRVTGTNESERSGTKYLSSDRLVRHSATCGRSSSAQRP